MTRANTATATPRQQCDAGILGGEGRAASRIDTGPGLQHRFLMEKHVYDLSIRVLVYQEDGEFVAHALEMDLLGYGARERDAVKDLFAQVRSQIAFATAKKNPDLIDFPAEPAVFERWQAAHRAQLRGQIAREKSATFQTRAVVLNLDAEGQHKITRKTRHQFTPVEARA
jgi:hypothetical protein